MERDLLGVAFLIDEISGWKSDTEETSKQKKLKQREPPWKGQVQ